MKSVALIVWLLTASGHEEVVVKNHYDDMPACEASALALSEQYARQGQKTRHLCQVVVEEVGDVDANGNPIEVH